MTIPVLLLGFNRPELIYQRVLELLENEVTDLYISIDGGFTPADLWTHTLSEIDVLCSGKTNLVKLVHSENLGLAKHITSQISTLLEEYEAIVVLEDDIRVSRNFLKNMEQGLSLQRNRRQLGTVGAFSPIILKSFLQKRNSWRTSPYFNCWGWVCTRDVWKDYVLDLSLVNLNDALSNSLSWKKLNSWQQYLWLSRFIKIQMNPDHTWDIQFQFLSFKNNFINLAPIWSLSDNDGFSDSRSVHTKEPKPKWWLNGSPYEGILKPKISWLATSLYVKLFEPLTTAGDSRLIRFRNKIRG